MAPIKPMTLCKKYMSSRSKMSPEMVELDHFLEQKGFMDMYISLNDLVMKKDKLSKKIKSSTESMSKIKPELTKKVTIGGKQIVVKTAVAKYLKMKSSQKGKNDELYNFVKKSKYVKMYSDWVSMDAAKCSMKAELKGVRDQIKKIKDKLSTGVEYKKTVSKKTEKKSAPKKSAPKKSSKKSSKKVGGSKYVEPDASDHDEYEPVSNHDEYKPY